MYAYSQIEYDEYLLDERIEKEMIKHKKFALTAISRFVISKESLFIKMLALSFFESEESAITLADELDLCKLDFLAVLDDFEGFKEEYLKSYDEAKNF